MTASEPHADCCQATKKSIHIRKSGSGLVFDYLQTWRAYGRGDKGTEFPLPDQRYGTLYPLEADTEKALRRLCARQYPGHPIHSS